MKLPFYSRKTCAELLNAVSDHLGFYSNGDRHLILEESKVYESKISLGDTPAFDEATAAGDADNAIALYNWLKIDPITAANAQVWTYLSHQTFVDYLRSRWSETNERTIKEHYFMKGRGFTPRVSNGLSRLWWGAHLTFKEDNADPFALTRTLFSLQDVSQAFLERAFGFSLPLLHTILKILADPSSGWADGTAKGEAIKAIAKKINIYGATAHLDGLPEDRLEFILRRMLGEQLSD